MEEVKKCPYCGRRLIVENERYCHFCEQDLSEFLNEKDIFPKGKKKI